MFRFFQRKSAVEARILEAIDNGVAGGAPAIKVSARQAFGVMAVFAAVRVISEDVAKLPAKLKRSTDEGSETAHDQPEHILLSRIGKQANEVDDGFTSMEWIEALVAAAALHGIGVTHLNRVGGKAREATPVPHGSWRCERNQWSIRLQNGKWENVPRSELIVLRGPQLGLNITQAARQSIDLARRLDLMMTSIARKAGRPNGIISSEGLTSQDKADTFVRRIKSYFGQSGDGGLMPVDLGKLNYIRLSMTPGELQQDETYSRVVTQIASAYRVQPARLMHAITDHNNASAYTWNIIHVQDCVLPWVKRFKQTFEKDALGENRVREGYYCDVALQGLLQGSPAERGKLYVALRTVGAMSPLTVAKLEDLPTQGVSNDPAFPLLTNPNPKEEKDGDEDD
ncbi:phage portal protein [Pacificoceanicola onchidii]|uniref:phage portal protein n=1 Tax=Pacificoceanicola onchidii TaxID=2562685 RepID=UPI0010A405C4|nr:phage portal protein [Pacificoceanicola onchidii]